MANHFSALKRARQTVKRSATNQANTSRLRGELRKLRETLSGSNVKAAQEQFRATVAAIDKAIHKGTLHKNTAARYKSRLSARLGKLSAK